ncbi:MAG: lipopolysaccharide biosynthesis protein [Anaerolineaceae bacterium]|jgi:O-antigen/teichoic acid export membrane protein|nr:lipopolysaccharide biosynthesis protein [Anaerolineaceae bacterium]
MKDNIPASPQGDEPVNLLNHSSKLGQVSNLANHFVADVIVYFPVAILPAIFALIGSMVFTRIYTPDEYGVFGFSVAIITPIVTFLTEWAAQPLGRFYSEFKNNQQLDLYSHVVSLFVTIAILILILGSSAILGGIYFVQGHWPSLWIFTGAVLLMISQCLLMIPLPILPASFQSRPYRFIVVSSSGLVILFPLMMNYLFGVNIAWMLWGQFFATILFVPYLYKITHLHLGTIVAQITPELVNVVKRFGRYGLPMSFWFLAIHLLNSGDRIVLQVFRTSAEVGIYSVNYSLVAGIVGLVNSPINLALGPLLYYQWKDRSTKNTEQTLSLMTELYIILALFVLAAVVVVAKPLVSLLLGEMFQAGVVILIPVLLGRMVWGLSMIGQKSLELNERTDLIVRSALVALLANVVLNIWLIPRFGFIAAAYTTIASNLIYALLIWLKTKQFVPWKLHFFQYAPYIFSCLISIGTGSLLIRGIEFDLLQLVIGGSVCLLTYAGLVYLFAGKKIRLLFKPETHFLPMEETRDKPKF